jgi:endonuclease-3
MVKLGLEGLISYVNKIGLYRNKSKYIMQTSKILIEKYKGEVPSRFEDLISLPGVGRKSADVILNVVFKKNTIPVDRHIFRVVHRVGMVDGKDVNQVADNLLKIVPKKYLPNAHHWLVLHGRYICKAQKPVCHKCPIEKHCRLKNARINPTKCTI